MGHNGRTGERVEMEATMADNDTLVVEEIDSWVARIECLCLVYFLHLMPPHCDLGVVVSQTGSPVEPDWLSSSEIHSLTSYVNKMMIVIKESVQLVISNEAEYS
jgi:hypothetical protein